jgi:chromosome segregation ATPase
MDITIRDYESKIDNLTLKYLDKIDGIKNEKEDIEEKLATLQDEHDRTSSQLRSTQNELSANKYAYETRIKKLEDQLDDATDRLQQKIKSLENELDSVHDDKSALLKEKLMLAEKVDNFEADLEDANIALGQLADQLTKEREDHEAKIDDVTMSLSGAIDKLTAEKKDLTKLVENLEDDLDDRENNISKLERELENAKQSYEDKIDSLNSENDQLESQVRYSVAFVVCTDGISTFNISNANFQHQNNQIIDCNTVYSKEGGDGKDSWTRGGSI